MPLPRLFLETSNTPAEVFTDGAETGGYASRYNVDTPYQRGHVWGEERKRNLIRSLLIGIPTGIIVVNYRGENAAAFEAVGLDFRQSHCFAVIDGKQRITALRDFTADRFAVPAEWFEERMVQEGAGEMVRYSDLTEVGKRRFGNQPLSVATTHVASIEEEKEVFELINFGGLAQGESDL